MGSTASPVLAGTTRTLTTTRAPPWDLARASQLAPAPRPLVDRRPRRKRASRPTATSGTSPRTMMGVTMLRRTTGSLLTSSTRGTPPSDVSLLFASPDGFQNTDDFHPQANCENLWPNEAYCIGTSSSATTTAAATTAPSSTTTTSATGTTVTPPGPAQSGIPANCDAYALAPTDGTGCYDFAAANSITLDQLCK